MDRIPISIIVVTALLALNCVLAVAGGPLWLMASITAAGPFLVVWMVVHTLRSPAPEIRDLEPGEEWGYQDRPDLRPGR